MKRRTFSRPFAGGRESGVAAILAAMMAMAVGGIVFAVMNQRSNSTLHAGKMSRGAASAQDGNMAALALFHSLLERPIPSERDQDAGNLPALYPDPYIPANSQYRLAPIGATSGGLWDASALLKNQSVGISSVTEDKLKNATFTSILSGAGGGQLRPSAVKVLSVNHSGLLVTDVDVQTTSTNPENAGETLKLTANVKIDPPPRPTCTLGLAGASEPLTYDPNASGTPVSFVLYASGVAASGNMSAGSYQKATPDYAKWALPGTPTRSNSVTSVNTPIATFVFFANPTVPPMPLGATFPWKLSATVTGVQGGVADTYTCSTTVQVRTPPPTCDITGSGDPIRAVIMASNYTTSATIQGVPVALNWARQGARMVQPTGAVTTLVGHVTGPGGSRDCTRQIQTPPCTPPSSVPFANTSFDPSYCPNNMGQKTTTSYYPLQRTGPTTGQILVSQNWQYCDSHYHPVQFLEYYSINTAQYGGVCPFQGPIGQNLISNGDGCLAGTALVTMADGSRKPVRDVKAGDRVLNPLSGIAEQVGEVTATPAGSERLVVLATARRSLTLTANHPVMTLAGVRAAGEVRVGDLLTDADGGWQRVTERSSRLAAAGESVYNLILRDAGANDRRHFFAADGLVVGDRDLQGALELRDLRHRASFPTLLGQLRSLTSGLFTIDRQPLMSPWLGLFTSRRDQNVEQR